MMSWPDVKLIPQINKENTRGGGGGGVDVGVPMSHVDCKKWQCHHVEF